MYGKVRASLPTPSPIVIIINILLKLRLQADDAPLGKLHFVGVASEAGRLIFRQRRCNIIGPYLWFIMVALCNRADHYIFAL